MKKQGFAEKHGIARNRAMKKIQGFEKNPGIKPAISTK